MTAYRVSLIAVTALLVAGAPQSSARATGARDPSRAVRHATAVHHPDFNGDGFGDLVVSAPGDTVNGATSAGGVWVLYGGAHGANTGNRHQYFTETSIGRGASSATNDNFGYRYVTGDFNGDGYDDLAVGANNKTVGGQPFAGAVVVLYGSAFGLITGNAQFFTEATSGMSAVPEQNDDFGSGLAAGDFNHDGRDDLAVGARGEKVGSVTGAGSVFELFGTAHGLSHSAPLLPRRFDETTPGLHGGAKSDDDFGSFITVGDFDGDGFVDVAVAAPDKDVNGVTDAGAVYVLRGSSTGLTGTGAQTWTQDTSGVPDASEPNDVWGITLIALDVNGDGRSELVIGAPLEDQGATANVGTATLLTGSAHGLTANGAVEYLLSNTTFGQSPAANDVFAATFAPLDFDGDGRPDLAISVEGRTVSAQAGAGEVVVLHNVGGRLSRSGGFVLSRATNGMIGPPGPNQSFGSLLRGGDWSGNGRDDLAVSLPYLKVSGLTSAGGMQVFYGTSSGVGTNDQLFTANTLGGTPHQNAFLGDYDLD